ncbi:MAG TPA: hypothetical protein VJZ71_11500 [Phycisphaerae bacterium]|nr:hypothetical protein [Phycisphaerae bacterium]
MAFNWIDFRSGLLEKRFLLPVSFRYKVEFVRIEPDPGQLLQLRNFLIQCVVGSIRDREDCPLYTLQHQAIPASSGKTEDGDEGAVLFAVALGTPVYDFGLLLTQTGLHIVKNRSSLQDLILTVPIFEDICQRLFPVRTPAADNKKDRPLSLLDCLGMAGLGLVHRVIFRFEQRLRLGTHITEQRDARNTELLGKLIKAELPHATNHADREAPIASIQPEDFKRGDVTLSFTKQIAGRPRGVWIAYEGPYNVTQQDVDLTFQYRCGEGDAPMIEDDIRDWDNPFKAFYRDTILNRFMPNLLFDIHVEPRI